MKVVVINLDEHGATLTSRDLGKEIREKIRRLIGEGNRITINLSKIELMTSAFSDELFGVLFEELGAEGFRANLVFSFPVEEEKKKLIVALIGKAINDRRNRNQKN